MCGDKCLYPGGEGRGGEGSGVEGREVEGRGGEWRGGGRREGGEGRYTVCVYACITCTHEQERGGERKGGNSEIASPMCEDDE